MTLQFVDIAVPVAYCFVPPVPRPVAGAFLHNTVTTAPARCRPDGSWHYQVLRDGTIERHVDEANCAFGVRACDRWRPDWVLASPYPVSDANYCGLQIELESFAGHPACPPDYVPYTDAQYQALAELVWDIDGRYQSLPIVGHGQVQADRSDPVSFDWPRFWATWSAVMTAGTGDTTGEDDDEMACRDELQRVTAERDQLNGVNAELGRQLAEKDRLLQEANSAAGAWQEEAGKRQQRLDALAPRVDTLQAQVDQLSRALDQAGHRAAREVVVTYDDGTSQRFAPAPQGS